MRCYREVILPPIWLISFIYFMLFSLVLAIWAAFNDAAAINAALVAVVIGAMAIFYMRSRIEVRDGELRINKAHIPLNLLGDVEIIDRKNFSFARTRGADPAAYLATIFWISEGIKVHVTDSLDPTPYWLISTRNGEKLAQALKS